MATAPCTGDCGVGNHIVGSAEHRRCTGGGSSSASGRPLPSGAPTSTSGDYPEQFVRLPDYLSDEMPEEVPDSPRILAELEAGTLTPGDVVEVTYTIPESHRGALGDPERRDAIRREAATNHEDETRFTDGGRVRMTYGIRDPGDGVEPREEVAMIRRHLGLGDGDPDPQYRVTSYRSPGRSRSHAGGSSGTATPATS